MRLSCRLGSVLPFLVILFFLLTLALLPRKDDPLPVEPEVKKPARSRSKPLDLFTHFKTKLKLPEPGVLERQPSRETTEIIVPNDRIVVMAKLSFEPTDWVPGDLSDWRYMIYTVDDQTAPTHTPKNKGKESLAYLQYIVDHYNDLPSTIVFIHAHKTGFPQSWHIDNERQDNADSVRTLKLDYVQSKGYVNLRCQHSVGCPVSLRPSRNSRDTKTVDGAYWTAWEQLFNNSRVPKEIGVPCCSQFAVSKKQVLQRPLSDYRHFYNWVLENDLPDNVTAGIMENTWHIIFGQEPVHCPDQAQCYENQFKPLDTEGHPDLGWYSDVYAHSDKKKQSSVKKPDEHKQSDMFAHSDERGESEAYEQPDDQKESGMFAHSDGQPEEPH